MRDDVTAIYTPWPKQAEALWMLGCSGHAPPDGQPVNQLLYGGIAGGGKSMLDRMVAGWKAVNWPGSRFSIFRRKLDDLLKNHVDKLRDEVPERYGTFNFNRMEFKWWNGSVTEFHHLEKDDSYKSYQGYEWGGGVAVDESTTVPWEAIPYLYSRVRAPNQPGFYKTMILTTNPGGQSHQEHKLHFIEGHQWGQPFWGPEERVVMPDGTIQGVRPRRLFLRALLSDNPSLDYADTMAGLMQIADPLIRRAHAYGDWDLPVGQMFAFDRRIHVVEPFEIPKHWPRWRAVDWGWDPSPFYCGWFCQNPDVKWREIYQYREVCQTRLPTQLQARLILSLSQDDPPVRATFADPSMWRHTKGAGASEADEYQAGGIPLTRANNDRHAGWNRLHRALFVSDNPEHPDQVRVPELRIFSTCVESIKELANTQRSERDWEDIKQPTNDTDMRDEAIEVIRYALQGERVAQRRTPPQRYALVAGKR